MRNATVMGDIGHGQAPASHDAAVCVEPTGGGSMMRLGDMPQRPPLRRATVGMVTLLVFWVALGTGCQAPPPPAHPLRWARAWISSLNTHRVDQVAPLLSPKATYEDPFTGGPRMGPELAFVLAGMWMAHPNVHYELKRVTGDQQLLAVEWAATGLGAAPSEVPVDGVFLIQLQDNIIVNVRAYFDGRALQ